MLVRAIKANNGCGLANEMSNAAIEFWANSHAHWACEASPYLPERFPANERLPPIQVFPEFPSMANRSTQPVGFAVVVLQTWKRGAPPASSISMVTAVCEGSGKTHALFASL